LWRVCLVFLSPVGSTESDVWLIVAVVPAP